MKTRTEGTTAVETRAPAVAVPPDPPSAPETATATGVPELGAGRAGLRQTVREDFVVHGGSLTSPAFRALLVHRFGVGRHTLRPALLRMALRPPYSFFRRRMQNRYRLELHHGSRVGRRLRLPDVGGVVVGNAVRIGDDVTIGPGVTIGRPHTGSVGWPVIGDRVVIGPGAIVLGEVEVGDDAVIGPNAVVVTDVPAGAVVTARASEVSTEADVRSPGPSSIPPAAVGPPLTLHRLRQRVDRVDGVLRRAAARVLTLVERVVRALHQVELPTSARIGRDVRFGRRGRVLVAEGAVIGHRCVIAEGVVVGWPRPDGDRRPVRLGHGVRLSPGVVVLAGVFVGDGAHVGPNAVVSRDVPEGAVVAAAGARTLKPMHTRST